jgi:hypothetical protein
LYSGACSVVSGMECEMLSLSSRRIHKSKWEQMHRPEDLQRKADTVLSTWWVVPYKNKQTIMISDYLGS